MKEFDYNFRLCKIYCDSLYRAVAIRFRVIRLVVCAQERYTLGGMLPRKILKFRDYEIVSETNFGQYNASRRPVSHECHSAHFVVHQWCQLSDVVCLSAKSHPFAGEACETNCSLVRMESCWKTYGKVLSHCSQPSHKFQHGTYVLWG